MMAEEVLFPTVSFLDIAGEDRAAAGREPPLMRLMDVVINMTAVLAAAEIPVNAILNS
ncbi:hypothetical protein [Neobacillus kokaensis]|uniref:hypothetical protein n=1 Tax=Neobacillus kokaensis TaxID=2759023 RepID=UPI0027E3E0B0|nr:hypothetical protein [Neobacillus kokaensis]